VAVEQTTAKDPRRLGRGADGARTELYCGACGYGVVVADVPPACPMCRSQQWAYHPLRQQTIIR
jgi:rubrerythrin